MIESFIIKNYRSYRDATELSFIASKKEGSKTKDLPPIWYKEINGKRILRLLLCVGLNVNPAKRNVLDLKNETCKNREKRNVLKNSHTRHFKTTKKQSKTGCFYSCMLGMSIV